eukprot:NODE_2063_length_1289_cov_33.479346_g1963_i0.p1 GENE.NODE_2063_length_1289_cov_33.479346_g1963_i0~~NODE_2063_length_1289_cov_33.479346_g1963_i0.p1  ORF type:complete len:389 (+),score=80.02 NODE_2063_length_1289_cov_33.479346_g1963_i0:52-1218(+)
MQSVQQGISKLDALLATGLITQSEYQKRREALLDQFMGQAPSASVAHGFAPPMIGGMGMARGKGMGMARGMAMAGKGMMRGGMRGAGGLRQPHYAPYTPSGDTTSIKLQPLNDTHTAEQVAAAMAVFGEVRNVCIKSNGLPIYGFVNFNSTEAARAAVAAKAVDLEGWKAQVTPAKKQIIDAAPSAGLGIFNLPMVATEADLKAMLKVCSGVQTLKMVRNPDGTFKGFCFVYFDTVENATKALETLTGYQVGDQMIDVKYALSDGAGNPVPQPTDGVGIFNLPLTTTEAEMIEMLKCYEGFQSLKFKQSFRSSYCFAYFNTVANAEAVLAAFTGQNIGGQELDVKFAHRNSSDPKVYEPIRANKGNCHLCGLPGHFKAQCSQRALWGM